MKRLAECVPGREIRAGTRKLHSRPQQTGFTIKSSSSEQLSRFLQDQARSELRLTVLRATDRNKIMHLANLYSLSVRTDVTTDLLVLTKTGKTVRFQEFAKPGTPPASKAPIEFKKRRKTPESSPLLDEMNNIGPAEEVNTDDVIMGVVPTPPPTPMMNRSESPILGASVRDKAAAGGAVSS